MSLPWRQISRTLVNGKWIVNTVEYDEHVDLSNGVGLPCRYETCVFDIEGSSPYWQPRGKYPDEGAAKRGHTRIVKLLKGGERPR